MVRSPTRRTPSPRIHKKTLSFRTGCLFFSLCRWYSSNLSDVTWIWSHPQRVWSMLPWLPCLGSHFHSWERIRWTWESDQSWTYGLGWTCLYYTHENAPNGANGVHFGDWHMLGSISHSWVLRCSVMPSICRIALLPTCQPPRMTNKIKTYLMQDLLEGIHIGTLRLGKIPTCPLLAHRLKMKSSLGWSGHGASNSGSRSEICSLKNCVGLQLRD